MTREQEFILNTVIKQKNESESAIVSELLKDPLDWCEISGQVVNHRLGGYFFCGLTEEQKNLMPKELRAILELVLKAQENQMIRRIEEFSKVKDTLNEAKVRYCGIKGIVYVADFYNFCERRSNDIDLLVYEEDLDTLDSILRSMGYIQSNLEDGELKEASRKQKLIQRMNHHDLVPYVKKLGDEIIEIDINFKFDTKGHDIEEQIFDYGIVEYEKDRFKVKGLPFYTHLCFLCTHFYREATDSIWIDGRRDVALYKIVDIYNCIKAHYEKFNTSEWCELVNKLGLSEKCYYTFYLLQRFFTDQKIENIVESLKPSNTEFINEFYDQNTKHTVQRNYSFLESCFDWKM